MRGSPESSAAVTGTKREPSGFQRKEIEKGLSWELQEAKGGRKAVCAPARRSQRGCEQTQMLSEAWSCRGPWAAVGVPQGGTRGSPGPEGEARGTGTGRVAWRRRAPVWLILFSR